MIQLKLPFESVAAIPVVSIPTVRVPVANLAEVAVVVKAEFSGRRRADVLSALSTLGRALDRTLEELPADPAALRGLLENCDPMLKGLTDGRWTKVRQHLGSALRSCGVDVFQARERTPLSAAWEELLRTAALKRDYGLQRMLKYFTLRGIEPGNVRHADLEQFRLALVRTSLTPNPQKSWKDASRLWNQAAVNSLSWPRIVATAESRVRRLSVPWETFPQSFNSDVEAFLRQKEDDIDDFAFDEAPRPIAATTAAGRRKQLRLIASAYHRATGLAHELVNLAILTEPDRAQVALASLRSMQGGLRPTTLIAAELLLTIARHWVQADDDRVAKLSMVVANARRSLNSKNPTKGMRPKNRERLRQFDDPETLAALMDLPERVRRRVCRISEPTNRDACRLMYAVAIEILLVAPLRLKNLTSLQNGRHLQWSGRRNETCRLLVQSDELKWQGEAIDTVINGQSSVLIRDYLDNYRRLVTPQPTDYLFPNSAGACRNLDGFSAALTKFVSKEIGARIHVHLFRALALKIHLNARPHALDEARRLLGHRSIATTEKHYIQFDNERAIIAHAEVVQSLRTAGGRMMRP